MSELRTSVGAGDPVTDPSDHPPTAEGFNVESYEAYVVRTRGVGGQPMRRVDWAREAGSAGAANPNGPVGPARPGHRPATDADSALIANRDRTDHVADVTRTTMHGTQIDPADGVRKPVEQIVRDDPSAFPTVRTALGEDVYVDRGDTQIGADGLRHPIRGGDDPTVPSVRTDG